MPDINYGILQNAAAPQAQTTNVRPNNDIGMLSDGLNKLFGKSSTHVAADALQGAVANADPKAVAAGLLGGAPPKQTAMMGDGGNVSPNYGMPSPVPKQGTGADGQLMMNSAPASLAIPDVYKAAQAIYKDNPTMAKLATAQAIQESNLNGTPSTLASKHNNLFGIKGTGSAGSVTMPTHEFVNGHMVVVPQQFAAYKTAEDSMIAHKALMSGKRYKGVMNADNISDAATELGHSGYATDPNYSKSVMRLASNLPEAYQQVEQNYKDMDQPKNADNEQQKMEDMAKLYQTHDHLQNGV